MAQESDPSYFNKSTDDNFESDSDNKDSIHLLDNSTSENDKKDLIDYSTDKVITAENTQEDEKYLSLLSSVLDENVKVHLPTTNWIIRIKKEVEAVFFCLENVVFNETEFPYGTWQLNFPKMVVNLDFFDLHIFIN